MKKTLLIGNFGRPNIGDELILNAALEQYPDVLVMTNNAGFSQNFCEQRFQCVPFFPTGGRSFLRFVFSKTYRHQLWVLKEKVDQVVFPGGGLFAIKFRAVLLWFIMFLWVRKVFGMKVPVHFDAQGIDANIGWISKLLVKYVFSRADRISVRDVSSAEVLKNMGINNVEVGGDRVVTFLENQTIWKRGGISQKLVLINSLSKIRKSKMKKILEEFRGYRKVFLAFEERDRTYIPKGLQMEVIFPKTKMELFTYFIKAEKTIGERFHFLVLGVFFCGRKNTFVLKSPYSEKVQNFVKKRGVRVWENG